MTKKTGAILFYCFGLVVSSWLLFVFLNTPSYNVSVSWDLKKIASKGFLNVVFFTVQLITQIKVKNFELHLLLESFLVTFIYIQMKLHHAYGNWMNYLFIVYIALLSFFLVKNIREVYKKHIFR